MSSLREHTGFGRGTAAVLYLGCLTVATAYGFLLLLPAYVKGIGGTEIDAGRVLAAGAAGAIAAVAVTGRFSQRAGPAAAASAGSVIYSLAAGMVWLSSRVSPQLYVAGALLGVGWALFFTAAPIALSAVVPDDRRSTYFSVLAGFNALGMGLAPVLGHYLLSVSVSYSTLFLVSTLLSGLSAILFLALSAKLKQVTLPAAPPGRGNRLFGPLRRVVSSPARPFFVMVFLGACVFTSMMAFNATYAGNRGLNYSVFYACYTVGVIVPRFTVSAWMARQNPRIATVVLLALMCLAVTGFLLVNGNTFVYGSSSVLLGLSYGLVYPLIQAQAVNVSEQEVRHWVLSYFSMAYFVAVFGFPLLAGEVIVWVGYQGLFLVLLLLALLELAVAARQTGKRKAGP